MTELRPLAQNIALSTLCSRLRIPPVDGAVSGLTLDTRLVQRGDLFAALPGANAHGANFAAAALAAGAAAILTDAAGAALLQEVAVPVLVDEDPRAHLGELATLIYPTQRPTLIGITGTNGKTTTAHCVAAAAEAAGVPTAVLGTLGVRFRELQGYSGRTTPERPACMRLLRRLPRQEQGWRRWRFRRMRWHCIASTALLLKSLSSSA